MNTFQKISLEKYIKFENTKKKIKTLLYETPNLLLIILYKNLFSISRKFLSHLTK